MTLYSLTFLVVCSIAAPVLGQFTTSGCLFTMEQLVAAEEAVSDYSVGREYIICENQRFELGTLDINNEFVENSGSPFFPVRPNLLIKCGGSGARENNCIVSGGDVQVDATNYLGTESNLDVTNVTFVGITFTGAKRYSVWANKPGDITFIDCEWKDMTETYAPIYFDYYDPSNLRTILDASFITCKFQNIVYYGDGDYPAIITANGDQNHLMIERCDFDSNDYVNNNTQFEKNSFLIESSGALTMNLNCFTNNSVGVSIAVAYGVALASENNYGSSSDGGTCPFLANFENASQFESFKPTCISYETDVCKSDTTGMPSASPTMYPTTLTPSSSPSAPTMSPSGSILPSLLPTNTPTGMPTTLAPSNNDPSASPSVPATERPTRPSASIGCSIVVVYSLFFTTIIATISLL